MAVPGSGAFASISSPTEGLPLDLFGKARRGSAGLTVAGGPLMARLTKHFGIVESIATVTPFVMHFQLRRSGTPAHVTVLHTSPRNL